jgi:hypothetical protein
MIEVTRFVLTSSSATAESANVTLIQVMDDFLMVGEPAAVQEFAATFEQVFSLLGFSAATTKRWTWSATNPTRWLGADWLWDSVTGELTVMKKPIEARPLQLTKRAAYAVAGEAYFITGSFPEAIALGHANVARKLTGKSPGWDTPVDLRTAAAASLHLAEMKRHWNSSLTEKVALFHSIRSLRIETDASLSGSGFSCQDAVHGSVVFAEAFIATPTMRDMAWHCNRCELNAILQAVRRLMSRIELFPALESVLIQTDSMVAASHCDRFSRPGSGSLERTVLTRISLILHSFLEQLSNRGIRVGVSHIAGLANAQADQLSRIPEAGNYGALVFDRPNAESQNVPEEVVIRRIGISDVPRETRDPDLNVLQLSSFRKWLLADRVVVAWRTKVAPDFKTVIADDFSRFVTAVQSNDEFCKRRSAEVKCENPSAKLYEIHGGILFLREPVTTNYPQAGWRNQPLRLVLPANVAAEYAMLVHRQCGHLGRVSTLARCRERIDCDKFGYVVKQTIAGCLQCQTANTKPPEPVNQFGPIPLPRRTFAILGIDLFGPLRRPASSVGTFGEGDGEREGEGGEEPNPKAPHFLTVCCRRTGYTKFAHLPNAEAKTVCDHLGIVLRSWGCEGLVEEIWSDNGRQFLSAVFQALILRLPGVYLGGPAAPTTTAVRHKTIPVRTPHLGGHWETHHREAKHVLKRMLAEWPQASWPVLASFAEAKVNFHREKGYPSPHQLVFGRDPITEAERLPLQVAIRGAWDSKRPHFSYDLSEEALKIDEQRNEFERVWDDRFRQLRVDEAMKRARNKEPKVSVGDLVLLPREGLSTRKLDMSWGGPKNVTAIRGKLVQVDGEDRWWSVDKVKKFVTGPLEETQNINADSSSTDNEEVDQAKTINTPEESTPTEENSETKRHQAWVPQYSKSFHGRTIKRPRRD